MIPWEFNAMPQKAAAAVKKKMEREMGKLRLRLMDLEALAGEMPLWKERAAILDAMADPLLMMDMRGNIAAINPAFTRMFCRKREEVVGKKWREITVQKEHVGENASAMKDLVTTGRTKFVETTATRGDGVEISIWVTAALFKDAHGKPKYYIATIRDITERRKMQEEIEALALQDELTGLYNRRAFLMLAQQQLKISDRTKREQVLLFADVDNLKRINDAHGHKKGDQVLKYTAKILVETFRKSDIIARVGGDEFAILAVEARGDSGETIAARFQTCLKRYNRAVKRSCKLGVSIGSALYDPSFPCAIDNLMDLADQDMYRQKRKRQKRRVIKSSKVLRPAGRAGRKREIEM